MPLPTLHWLKNGAPIQEHQPSEQQQASQADTSMSSSSGSAALVTADGNVLIQRATLHVSKKKKKMRAAPYPFVVFFFLRIRCLLLIWNNQMQLRDCEWSFVAVCAAVSPNKHTHTQRHYKRAFFHPATSYIHGTFLSHWVLKSVARRLSRRRDLFALFIMQFRRTNVYWCFFLFTHTHTHRIWPITRAWPRTYRARGCRSRSS